jgi:predicted RNA-binding protein associated with RNAse of E/G family
VHQALHSTEMVQCSASALLDRRPAASYASEGSLASSPERIPCHHPAIACPQPAVAELASSIAIHYRRPPDGERIFRQRLLGEFDGCLITLLEAVELDAPVVVGGARVLEAGASMVWFTFRGAWHDVGRFHLPDGTFTGFYANILTPMRIRGSRWETTDLFLDVWLGADGRVEILDEDEFETACERGWIDPPTALRARTEADAVAAAARAGRWPPSPAGEWELSRARAVAASAASS